MRLLVQLSHVGTLLTDAFAHWSRSHGVREYLRPSAPRDWGYCTKMVMMSAVGGSVVPCPIGPAPAGSSVAFTFWEPSPTQHLERVRQHGGLLLLWGSKADLLDRTAGRDRRSRFQTGPTSWRGYLMFSSNPPNLFWSGDRIDKQATRCGHH